MSDQAVGIVLLAAGASERYGAAKLVLPIAEVPLVRRAALAAVAVGASVVVVTGADADKIAPLVDDLAADVCFNANWQRGIGNSIAFGVARLLHLRPELRAVLIMLADQYRIGTLQLNALMHAHARNPNAIVAAEYAGTHGVPCVFPVAWFDRLCRLRAAAGAQALLHEHAGELCAVPLPEAASDIDTPHDYSIALASGE